MKATELMIGDWVTLNGVDYQWQWTHHDFTASEFGTLTPIPLTPEILMKNGWKWRIRYTIESLKLLSEDGHCLMSLTYGKKISVGGHEIEIKYVHELQHALRLCGLDELADNFQI